MYAFLRNMNGRAGHENVWASRKKMNGKRREKHSKIVSDISYDNVRTHFIDNNILKTVREIIIISSSFSTVSTLTCLVSSIDRNANALPSIRRMRECVTHSPWYGINVIVNAVAPQRIPGVYVPVFGITKSFPDFIYIHFSCEHFETLLMALATCVSVCELNFERVIDAGTLNKSGGRMQDGTLCHDGVRNTFRNM